MIASAHVVLHPDLESVLQTNITFCFEHEIGCIFYHGKICICFPLLLLDFSFFIIPKFGLEITVLIFQKFMLIFH
jgi:hypothetical protein